MSTAWIILSTYIFRAPFLVNIHWWILTYIQISSYLMPSSIGQSSGLFPRLFDLNLMIFLILYSTDQLANPFTIFSVIPRGYFSFHTRYPLLSNCWIWSLINRVSEKVTDALPTKDLMLRGYSCRSPTGNSSVGSHGGNPHLFMGLQMSWRAHSEGSAFKKKKKKPELYTLLCLLR